MKDRQNKFVIFLIMSVLLILTVLVSSYYYSNKKYVKSFVIKNGNQTINLWRRDDTIYAFLPGNKNADEYSIHLLNNDIYIDGEKVKENQIINYSFNEPHKIKSSFGKEMDIIFYKSSPIPSIDIQSKGNYRYVNNDPEKKTEVKISFDLFDGDGKHLYGSSNVKFKGRGNSTWKETKKPYLLTFNEPVNLLGMSYSKQYILLANALDETNLKNKIVMDFVNEIEYGWSPKCEFVDLYIDGNYFGLYLLSESIDIAENKLDFADDYCLFYQTIPQRENTKEYYFQTDSGRAFNVDKSGNIDLDKFAKDINNIDYLVENGADDKWLSYIDIDSFARKYLIEEVFQNCDINSNYFYKETETGKLFAGPAWDYDLAFGSSSVKSVIQDSRSLIYVARMKKAGIKNPWFSGLYATSKTFRSRVKVIFMEEFLPRLEELDNNGIRNYMSKIEDATICNNARWEHMFRSRHTRMTIDEVQTYFDERLDFLKSIWINKNKYHTVRVDLSNGNHYLYFYVSDGEVFDYLPSPEDLSIPKDVLFLNAKTNEEFDFSIPITQDYLIKATYPWGYELKEKLVPQKDYSAAILTVFAGCSLFFILLILDYKKNKWRGNGKTK